MKHIMYITGRYRLTDCQINIKCENPRNAKNSIVKRRPPSLIFSLFFLQFKWQLTEYFIFIEKQVEIIGAKLLC